MTRIRIAFFAIVLSLSVQTLGQELLDRIVAIVDDEIILESEVTQMAWMMASQMSIDPARDQEKFNELRKSAVQNFVTKELLVIQADKDTVEVDERQVEGYLEQQMQNAIQQSGGQDKLEKIFGMTLSQIRRNYREDIEKELRAKAVQDQKMLNVAVSRRETKEFFESVKDSIGRINDTVDISHILVEVKPGEKARMEAMERAIQIRKNLLDGGDFEALAKELSDDPGSAPRGGDLGFMSREDFVREYAEAAFKLEPNVFSDVIESQFGFHIIELLDKRGEKIHTRHILTSIKPTPDDDVVAAEKIKDIYKQLEEGADFSAMVIEHSNDPSTNQDQGHLGVYEVDQLKTMAKEFVFALRDVKIGSYSEPVKTQYGFHVLKLNNREDAREIDFEKDYDRIAERALNFKKQKELQKWMEKIKQEVFIEYKDESLM